MSNKRKAQAARKPRGGKVYVGYLHPADVSAAFHKSMCELLLFDAHGPKRIVGGGGRYSSANVAKGRNEHVEAFLAHPARPEWLLMLDSDMVFEPSLIEDLLVEADADVFPIVGGLCFGIADGLLFPTLYGLTLEDGKPRTVRYNDVPENAMFQVAATGAACLLIHRRVLTAMAEAAFNSAFPWFQETELSGEPCGEDFTFCIRAGQLGFPVHVATAVHVGHHKSQVLTYEMFRAQRAAQVQEIS